MEVDILSLKSNNVELSDFFEVYVISDSYVIPQTILFSDLSDYFYGKDEATELSAKYDELMNLLSSFKQFLKNNYPSKDEIPDILTTMAHLSSVMEQMQTVDKVQNEFLNDYVTTEYADFLKASAYEYHETLANIVGKSRMKILQSVTTNTDQIV